MVDSQIWHGDLQQDADPWAFCLRELALRLVVRLPENIEPLHAQ